MSRRLAAVGVVVALLGGCASIPRSGPVTEVEDDTGLGQSTVNYSPALPADGATPEEIVKGYVDAMLAYPASSRTAAAFLTPDAAESWRPQEGFTIYDSVRTTGAANGSTGSAKEGSATATVGVDLTEDARLDARGRYSSGRGERSLGLTVVRVDGQWRIDDPPAGMLVSSKFFDDYFRPFNLYFFDESGTRLVPTPVHLEVDDRLAAALVVGLARGPFDDSLRSALPAADRLRSTVPVDDGTADVGFVDSAPTATRADEIAAQLVWTLRQVPMIEGVRIGYGAPSVSPADVRAIDSYDDLGPPPSDGTVHAISGDRLVTIDGDEVAPVDGDLGESVDGALGVGVSGPSVALVRPGRGRLEVHTGGDVESLTGEDLLDPVSDVGGTTWVVDAPDGRTRVRLLEAVGPRTIRSGALAALDVTDLAISPDLSRYAVVTGSGESALLRVGSIRRDADDRVVALGAPTVVVTDADHVRSPGWTDPVRITYLGSRGEDVQVHTTLIDGSETTTGGAGGRAALPGVVARRLVVALGDEPESYVSDDRGDLWHLSPEGQWRRIAPDDPVESLTLDP